MNSSSWHHLQANPGHLLNSHQLWMVAIATDTPAPMWLNEFLDQKFSIVGESTGSNQSRPVPAINQKAANPQLYSPNRRAPFQQGGRVDCMLVLEHFQPDAQATCKLLCRLSLQREIRQATGSCNDQNRLQLTSVTALSGDEWFNFGLGKR